MTKFLATINAQDDTSFFIAATEHQHPNTICSQSFLSSRIVVNFKYHPSEQPLPVPTSSTTYPHLSKQISRYRTLVSDYDASAKGEFQALKETHWTKEEVSLESTIPSAIALHCATVSQSNVSQSFMQEAAFDTIAFNIICSGKKSNSVKSTYFWTIHHSIHSTMLCNNAHLKHFRCAFAQYSQRHHG